MTLSGRKWVILAEKTLDFLTIAKEYGFCNDISNTIRRRLFDLSPFLVHKEEKKDGNKNC